jgi:hypothetical protein
MAFQLDAAMLGTVATIVAIAVGLIGLKRYFDDRKRQSPLITIEKTSLLWTGSPNAGDIPESIQVIIANAGDGLATDIDVETWLMMARGGRFTVPSPEVLGLPHFTSSISAMRAGESRTVLTMRSGKAVQAGRIPRFDPDGVPAIKVTVRYSDRFKRKFEKKAVNVGTPAGFSMGGVDTIPS